jgi:hypothetical protein
MDGVSMLYQEITFIAKAASSVRSGRSQPRRDSSRHLFDVQADKSEKDLDSHVETTPRAVSLS